MVWGMRRGEERWDDEKKFKERWKEKGVKNGEYIPPFRAPFAIPCTTSRLLTLFFDENQSVYSNNATPVKINKSQNWKFER